MSWDGVDSLQANPSEKKSRHELHMQIKQNESDGESALSNRFKTKQKQGQGHHATVTITTEPGRTSIIYMHVLII